MQEQSSATNRRKHRQGCRKNSQRGVFAHIRYKDDVAVASPLDLTKYSFASVDADMNGLQSVAREGDMELELSIPLVLFVSSVSVVYVYSKDDPDLYIRETRCALGQI